MKLLLLLLIILTASPTFEIKIQFPKKSIIWEADVICNKKTVTGTLEDIQSTPQSYALFLVVKDINNSVLQAILRLKPVGIVVFGRVMPKICQKIGNISVVYTSISTGNFLESLVGTNAKVSLQIRKPGNAISWLNAHLKNYFGKFLLVIMGFVILYFLGKLCQLRIFPFYRIYLNLKKKILAKRLKKQISHFPTKIYKTGSEEICCAICIEEASDGEVIRTVPCGHKFHKECIDPWLLIKGSCPLCQKKFFFNRRSTITPNRNGDSEVN